ncbi:uncharacterized protein [Dendropsophus ebraccatus]
MNVGWVCGGVSSLIHPTSPNRCPRAAASSSSSCGGRLEQELLARAGCAGLSDGWKPGGLSISAYDWPHVHDIAITKGPVPSLQGVETLIWELPVQTWTRVAWPCLTDSSSLNSSMLICDKKVRRQPRAGCQRRGRCAGKPATGTFLKRRCLHVVYMCNCYCSTAR